MDPKEIGVSQEETAPSSERTNRRLAALVLMLFGAAMLIGAVAEGPTVPWPRTFAALLIWLIGCLLLAMPPFPLRRRRRGAPRRVAFALLVVSLARVHTYACLVPCPA